MVLRDRIQQSILIIQSGPKVSYGSWHFIYITDRIVAFYLHFCICYLFIISFTLLVFITILPKVGIQYWLGHVSSLGCFIPSICPPSMLQHDWILQCNTQATHKFWLTSMSINAYEMNFFIFSTVQGFLSKTLSFSMLPPPQKKSIGVRLGTYGTQSMRQCCHTTQSNSVGRDCQVNTVMTKKNEEEPH